jgi:hypothetical protein
LRANFKLLGVVGTIEVRDSEGRWVVQAKEILRMIERGEDVEIENRVIKGDLDLSELALKEVRVERNHDEINMGANEYAKCVVSSIKIKRCIIENFVNFSNAIFQKRVRFDDAIFHENVSFKGSKFYEEISFFNTQFDGHVDFDYAQSSHLFVFILVNFSGIVRISSAHFEGVAQFTRTAFEDNAIFIGSQFHADAIFGRSQFDGDAYFGSARFEGNANFSNVRFGKYLDFTAAKFEKNLNLSGSKIDDMKLHTNFKFDSKIELNDSNFGRIDVRWQWIKYHISYDSATYLALVKNFETLGRFDDADDCYYQYRERCRNLNNPIGENRTFRSELYDTVSFLSCGYGVRPEYTLACILTVMYIFWVIFLGCSRSIFEYIYFIVA